MDDNPTPKTSRSRVWIIIAIVAALLFTCLVACLAGAIAGYVAGRNVAQAQPVAPREERAVPVPERVPMPEMHGIPFSWALVVDVTEDSPADRAGLRVGDFITAVDGESLREEASLSDLIQQYVPGDEVDLVVMRDGSERTITVTLGRNPDGGDAPWLGLTYRQVPGGPPVRFEMPRMRDQRLPFPGGSQ